MQARYYDPVIGRFYSNDPIGFRDVHSFNRYGYANNNPYKYTDPDGNNPALAVYRSAQVGMRIGEAVNNGITTMLGTVLYDLVHNESVGGETPKIDPGKQDEHKSGTDRHKVRLRNAKGNKSKEPST